MNTLVVFCTVGKLIDLIMDNLRPVGNEYFLTDVLLYFLQYGFNRQMTILPADYASASFTLPCACLASSTIRSNSSCTLG